MIYRLDLVDNTTVRQLAQAISEIPGVITVHWFPPFKDDQKAQGGEDAMHFKAFILAPNGIDHLAYTQLFSYNAWSTVQNHPQLVEIMKQKLAEL